MPSCVDVEIGESRYSIRISESAGASISAEIARFQGEGRSSILICDAAVARCQAPILKRAFGAVPRLIVEGGERMKTLGELGRILEFLAAQATDRSGVLWIVGGGVLGDLAGFAAAVYLRGIACVQVPTTLLAMVDSSVGGKTGLNLPAGKNLVGAFHQPAAVFVSADLLATLPPREFAAGMGEVIKYGLLGDVALFEQLEQATLAPDSTDLLEVVRRCCELKAAIVAADERETAAEGGRALLNLGHTFGHAIEQATCYADYLHGEAVAIGLVGAARLSAKLGSLNAGDVARVESVLARHALPIRLRSPLAVAALSAAMKHDKKARAGGLRFIVLAKIGEARTQADIDPALVEAVWSELGATD